MNIQTEIELKAVTLEVDVEGRFGSSPFGDVEVYLESVVAVAARKGKELLGKLSDGQEALICEKLLEAYVNE